MLKLGRGVSRETVRKAVKRGRLAAISYDDVLQGEDIRQTLLGIQDAGSPPVALPLLSWLAGHPNTPEEVLRELERGGGREVLLSLAGNRSLPADLRQSLLSHQDDEIRRYANHVTCRIRPTPPYLQ